MKCFNHAQGDAVGSCKHCFKGVCGQCAKDTGMGIVCSPSCEAEVKTVHSMIERNKRMYAFAPKTHSRNAIWLSMLAVLCIAFGTFSDRSERTEGPRSTPPRFTRNSLRAGSRLPSG
jgi:hypothetical protein